MMNHLTFMYHPNTILSSLYVTCVVLFLFDNRKLYVIGVLCLSVRQSSVFIARSIDFVVRQYY